jgi:hypothetical protein
MKSKKFVYESHHTAFMATFDRILMTMTKMTGFTMAEVEGMDIARFFRSVRQLNEMNNG